MSLNGLDDPVVAEAYQAALNEAGGWLLLKYATRDTVDLLQSGSGGVVEVRGVVALYQDKSPVYGLVQYRRRKVILKYVPDGTSRLLQARLTVQFQSVLEKFTPHDTVFSFTAPTELTEAALSSACILHASIGSLTSSNSSLYRRRLEEITEDAEETGAPARVATPREEPKTSALRHSLLSDGERGPKRGKTSHLAPESHLPDRLERATVPASHVSEELPATTMTSDNSLRTPAPSSSQTPVDSPAIGEENTRLVQVVSPPNFGNPRHSSQSGRSTYTAHPSSSETNRVNHDSGYTSYKPKARLAPRPAARRPITPGSTEARPVANLPHSVRVSNRPPPSASRPTSSASSYRPTSQMSNKSAGSAFFAHYDPFPPPPLPRSPVQISAFYPPADAFFASRPSSPAPSTSTLGQPQPAFSARPPSATPEKQRLMRALQLRKKQQLARAKEVELARQNELNRETPQEPSAIVHESDSTRRGQTNENSYPRKTSASTRSTSPSNQSRLPGEGVVAPACTAQPCPDRLPQQDPMASVGPLRVDSSLDSKDAEMVSSTSESESATSAATNTSLKCIPPAAPSEAKADLDSGVAQQDDRMAAMAKRPVEESAATHSRSRKFSEQVDPELSRRSESNGSGASKGRLRHQKADLTEASSSAGASDTSENGSLYDGIQSASVEEAKSVTVARSTFSPVFNNVRSLDHRDQDRSTSMPSRKTDSTVSTPEKAKSGTRRTSSTLSQWAPPGEPAQPLLASKTNVSSGISQRIKALEILSTRGDGAPSSPSSTGPPSPPLTAGLVKKRMSSHSPQELLFRSPSVGTSPASRFQYPSPAPTPTSPSAGKGFGPRTLERKVSSPEPTVRGDKGDSTSVTARIVKGLPGDRSAETVNPSSPPAVNLRQSPLLVQHDQAEAVTRRAGLDVEECAARSSTSVGPESVETEVAQPETRRISLSSGHSNSSKNPRPDSLPRRPSTTSHGARRNSGKPPSASDSLSSVEDKTGRSSRKARLVKRISLLAGASRRSIVSALGSKPLQEGSVSEVSPPPASIAEDSGELSRSTSSTTDAGAHVVDIGDVNIQFPDNLLWKRRFMRIDEHGYLILTQPTMEANRRGISRRFHLSEFKRPSLPSAEREELPWSILLDLEAGSCLQCACESRYAQLQMLRLLTDAHDAYNGSSRRLHP